MKLYYRVRNAIRYKYWDFRARCQRFKRGYSYGDVWDMDLWFKKTVKPMLIHLRDHGIGIPNDLYVEEEDNRVRWEEVLTEMINCLDMMDEHNVKEHLGFGDFGAWTRMTSEDYSNIYNTMEENKNRFFELFSKHFYSLWD